MICQILWVLNLKTMQQQIGLHSGVSKTFQDKQYLEIP